MFRTYKNRHVSKSGFCFTPKGELINLPAGSTVVDFAYAVHTIVGDTCVGGKVNGEPAQLKRVLS
ncbi:MAG: TGS domain-containing protein, partial [Emcibacteraceae bacterium]|nr:TGS domain-containing protein [Emcibacteraceae bacterium]